MGRGETIAEADGALPRSDRLSYERSVAAAALTRSPLAGRSVPLLSLTGSRCHGLSRPDSDVDIRGVFLAGPSELFGLDPTPESLEDEKEDLVVWELQRFCKLAAAANPYALEALYAPALHREPLGERLLANRELFLSQHSRAAYRGFARSQMHRIGEVSDSDPRRDAKRAKHALHAVRALEQGIRLQREGTLEVRVSDPVGLREAAALPPAELRKLVDELSAELGSMPSVLPERAAMDEIDELIVSLRLESLDSP